MSCHSSGSLEGVCPSSVEGIEDTEDFIQFDGLYSRFSAVERFLYLRDFLNYIITGSESDEGLVIMICCSADFLLLGFS